MLKPTYVIVSKPESVSVIWPSPSLPGWALPAGIAVVCVGVAVVLFRKRLAAQLKGRCNPKVLLGAGVAMSLTGLLAVALAGPQKPFIVWAMTPAELAVKSLNGESHLAWKDVESIRLDEREPRVENASLAVKGKDGRTIWLVMKWLIPQHRSEILAALTRRAPAAAEPVVQNKTYQEKLRS
jgi:hypothetical protein